LCANNDDAAGYASANDTRLGKHGTHSSEILENQLGSYARIAKKGGGVKFPNFNVGDLNLAVWQRISVMNEWRITGSMASVQQF
jgi:hypothetical protein